MKVEGNSFSVPLKQLDDGGTPLLNFGVRYRQVCDVVMMWVLFWFSFASLECSHCQEITKWNYCDLYKLSEGIFAISCNFWWPSINNYLCLSPVFCFNIFLFSFYFLTLSILSTLFHQDKEGAEWKEMELPLDADSVFLQDLSFGSEYQLEVTAVNANGSSIPAKFNFTIAEQLGMWPLGAFLHPQP